MLGTGLSSLSLRLQVGSNGWPVAGRSEGQSTTAPAAAPAPAPSMPLLVGGPAPAPAPAPPLPAEPDLSPEECPQYYAINSYLYRLHMERLRRQRGPF